MNIRKSIDNGEKQISHGLNEFDPWRFLSPDLAGRFDDQFQFSPLIIRRNQVTFRYGSESTLRAYCEVIERNVSSGLIDAALECVERFKLRLLRCNQAQHDGFAGRHETQWLETAGSIGIVLEKKCIDVQRSEKTLGNGIVSAFGIPAALVVTATDVDSARYPRP